MSDDYTTLSRAQLSREYLHTNSTTHEFLFGALAELVDNARDASATKLQIFPVFDKSVRGGYMLCFLDDGVGMDPDEACDIVTFGKSGKKSTDTHMIGMYGNGLKSGSMRIGNDFILFTKKDRKMTCVFMSRTFHEEENISEVIVPIPSFDVKTKQALHKGGSREHEKHAIEMRLILKYSPFKSPQQFYKQFDRIESDSGSLVIIFNMKLLDNGNPELDVTTDPNDILLARNVYDEYDPEESMMPERRSFRAYTAILYKDPRMRIYIQDKKVRTKRLANTLYKARMYKWHSNRFKSRAEHEATKAKEASNSADYRAKEAESKARNLEKKSSTSKAHLAELRKAQNLALDLRQEANHFKNAADRKSKSLKDPKSLTFIFGINLDNRQQDGAFIYNCSRLIKMYEKIGPQADGGVFCAGVVAVVDVPYLVLEPTHNKQDFADSKEYNHLKKAMGMHMTQYWREINIVQQGVTNFWESFGYIDANWKSPPSLDPKYLRKRAMHVGVTLQCDACLKWRILPFSSSSIGKDFPDEWVCAMNPDIGHNECHRPEMKMNFSEGVYKKEIKTKDQKEQELEDQINKKREKLAEMKRTRSVASNRDLDSSGDESDELPSPPPQKKQAVVKPTIPPAIVKSSPKVEIKLMPVKQVKPSTVSVRPLRKPEIVAHRAEPVRSKPIMPVRSKPEQPHRKPIRSRPEPVQTRREPVRNEKQNSPQVQKRKVTPEPQSTRRNAPSKLVHPTSKDDPPFKVFSSTRIKLQEEVKPVSRVTEDTPKKKLTAVISASKQKSPSPVPNEQNIRQDNNEQVIVISSDEREELDVDKPLNNNIVIPGDEKTQNDGEEENVKYKKVEVKLRSEWHSGKVVREDKKQGKWKIKFDRNPRDKYDKWYSADSSDIRVLNEEVIEIEDTEESTTDVDDATHKEDVAMESTSSSNQGEGDALATAYSTCLRYFLPPDWKISKDDVARYSHEELVNFPLNEFFEHYEEGLKKLVSRFQVDAAAEAEAANAKLSNVRNMVATLLKAMNEEDIVIEDGDQIDECLAACVQQLQVSTNDDTD